MQNPYSTPNSTEWIPIFTLSHSFCIHCVNNSLSCKQQKAVPSKISARSLLKLCRDGNGTQRLRASCYVISRSTTCAGVSLLVEKQMRRIGGMSFQQKVVSTHSRHLRFRFSQLSRTPDYRWWGQMKISENPCFMYGQNFKNFPKNVRIGSGMHWKNQNLLRLPIWPPKMPNLFGLANWASKNAKFVQIGSKIAIFV